jgi:sulfur transfer complex TusBCD TusB component (DsrH family)
MQFNEMTNFCTPLEVLNLYYSGGKSIGNRGNTLWQKMNALLSWDNLLNRNYQTDLCPLLYFILTKALPNLNSKLIQSNLPSDNIVTDTIHSYLKEHFNSSLLRNMVLLHELNQVVEELKNNSITPFVLKGGFLAQNIYENIACRPMGDLDILVGHKDQEKCYKLFSSMGYTYKPSNHRNEELHKTYYKFRLGQLVLIEIHHRLSKPKYLAKFHTKHIALSDMLPIDYQFIFVSWHQIVSGLSRIIWLCDLLEIIRNDKFINNWNAVLNDAETFNVKKHFLFCNHMLSALFSPLCISDGYYQKIYYKHLSLPSIYLAETFFLTSQERILTKKNWKYYRRLLYLSLLPKKDIIKCLFAHIRNN